MIVLMSHGKGKYIHTKRVLTLCFFYVLSATKQMALSRMDTTI